MLSEGVHDGAGGLVPGGERVLLSPRASLWCVVLAPLRWLVLLGVIAAGSVVAGAVLPAPLTLWPLALLCSVVAAGLVVYWWLWRACARYVLTEKRVLARTGVLRRLVVDVPLSAIRTSLVHSTLLERVLGLGTVGVSTAASGGGLDAAWRWVRGPDEVLGTIRRAGEGPGVIGERGGAKGGVGANDGGMSDRPRVIGLAGGIASGKSHVARLLGEFGCLVLDSDRLAKDVLKREAVRDELVSWWGKGILTEDGRVDRAKVAEIVFKSAPERLRLEALVHPLVKRSRAEMVEAARDYGCRAAVIDAPLLFEAGVEKECDAVVFVDTPREERLERVKSKRGWSEEELDRRERAQMPLEEKRSRSGYVVNGSSRNEHLGAEVKRILEEVLNRGSRTADGSGVPKL
ncbi:MAG TPA: dephospho-CoA kinase [Phycisphaerales bacterium]|nr:dephospho-CoA kinase [Phycisphaerales bacterium]